MGQGLLLAINVATAPYIVHHLGAELFGILALVQTLAGFAGILNLGVGRALTKHVAELYWKNDVKAINRLFQTAWATCIVTGLAGLILVLGPRDEIGRVFFRGGPAVTGSVPFAIYVAAFGLFSSMLLEAISALPGALQRFDICSGVNVFIGVVRSLGSVAVLALGYSLKAVLVVNLGSNLLAVAAFAVFSCVLIPGLNLVPRFRWDAFRKLFDFSLPLLLSAISSLIVSRIDRFILAYFLPLAAVAFYTLPYSLSEKLAIGVTNVSSVVFPYTCELHARDAYEEVHELYLRATKILTLVTLPLTVIVVTLPGLVLRFWLGPEYAAQGAAVLCLIGIAMFLNGASAIPTVTSLGVGRPWVPATFALASSSINLASNLLLIPRYGINGAAMGQLLPQIVMVPVFIYYVNRMLKFSSWRLLSHAFLRPFVCAAVQCAVLLTLRTHIDSLASLALSCFASLCVFGVLSFFSAITLEERKSLFRVPSLSLH